MNVLYIYLPYLIPLMQNCSGLKQIWNRYIPYLHRYIHIGLQFDSLHYNDTVIDADQVRRPSRPLSELLVHLYKLFASHEPYYLTQLHAIFSVEYIVSETL